MSRELDAVIIYEAGFLIIMITKICLTCGKEFAKKPVETKKYFAIKKYCSRQCYGLAERGKHHTPKTEFQNGVKQSQEFIEKRFKALTGKYLGSKNWHWKGGKIKTRERWYIYQPEHPFANSRKYVFQSRLIAEKCLGRYLTRKEVIHHINGDTDDDRPENLYLFSFSKEHTKYHYLKNPPQLISNLL